ncbi:hypothetical protein D7223_04210 [Micromonospora endolithica]|uniref:Uncharacterized protein n=1 Tax=Micromonospora endolithica TaxID=230091 RepID=A0A3A9ZRQ0_9ACTN|nr:hypothetical protein D7223_04210 [Micromonospora endolithica]
MLARERGLMMRELVAELAGATPTVDELRERARRAEEYVQQHLAPELAESDPALAADTWTAMEACAAPEAPPARALASCRRGSPDGGPGRQYRRHRRR